MSLEILNCLLRNHANRSEHAIAKEDVRRNTYVAVTDSDLLVWHRPRTSWDWGAQAAVIEIEDTIIDLFYRASQMIFSASLLRCIASPTRETRGHPADAASTMRCSTRPNI